MILNGPNLKDQESNESQVCLTIGQNIIYNVKKRKPNSPVKVRHTLDREPPLTIYIGLNIHALTRSKKINQQLHTMGISVSYDRVMQLEDWLATAVCERFEDDGAVAPTILQKGLFTVGALDNLDHNPSSTTSKTSFHGTGISLFQFPSEREPGVTRQPVAIPPSGSQTHSLPDSYASVPAVSLKTTDVAVPQNNVQPIKSVLPDARCDEYGWIEHGLQLVNDTELSKDNSLTWSAYHASKQEVTVEPSAVCALLPLFYEKSATPAMIKHGMDVQRQATEYLNPGQIPVTTFDQPLFTLAKYVQWKWPDTYGEKVHVVMMGGLHIEMDLWNTVGDLLQGSGWTAALTEAEVASSGIADSFLKTAHLTRTRHAHQVTLLTLKKLIVEAFNQDPSGANDNDSFNNWHERMCKNCPTFKFWDLITQYEILILIFVRAHRERNFTLYISVLEELVPLFFALDHVNYARWLSVHIRDMKSLPKAIRDEFETRHHWVISKSTHRYSAIPVDQAHEQENKVVKGSGGAVGLTENPVAFKRWMTSGPELARLMKQFENEYILDDDPENPTNFEHHEQGLAAQKAFQQQVDSLSKVIQKMGNPFLDDFPELVTLDSRNCTSETIVNTIRTLEDIGTKKYQDYVTTVLVDRTRSIHNPMSKNSLPLFSTKVKAKSKDGKKVKVLENNMALFEQLYISLQNRDGDINDFFAHEVQSYPPSLSDFGKLNLPGTKSQLLQCIEEPNQTEPPASFDCKVLDGAVIVHCLPVTHVRTFHEYADNVFIPYLERQLKTTKRLDLVWDTYIPNSLKESTREKRGKGTRRKVSGDTKLPTNWNDFLRDPINKKELFEFLSSKVAEFNCPAGSSVYITAGENVICIGTEIEMSMCNQEEADTRIVVHVKHALENG
uniref:uncharacterized protein n=1 Tax=Myxine glutinosa TaxID=7769 RepID=UPI00358E5A52